MSIFYKLYDKLYVNLTNRCSCACLFCIRQSGESVGDARSLWLPHEPEAEEIRAAFDTVDLAGMTEIVYCGYGEPLERPDTVVESAAYIKSQCPLPVRINTNGLVRLARPDFDISRLCIADAVSVSLNADGEDEYLRVTRPRFGRGSFQAMLDFAVEVRPYTHVQFTVVDVLPPERLRRCRELAARLEIPLRVRHCVTDNESYT